MSLSPQEITYLDNLLWRTSTTRFIAAHRATAWLQALQISLLASNCYLISLSSLAFASRIKLEYESIASFSAIAASVFLLGFGLYIQFSGLDARANKFYASGRTARRLLNETKSTSPRSYNQIIAEYENAIDPLPNHSIVDNDSFILQNRRFLKKTKPADVTLSALIESGLRILTFYLFPIALVYFSTVLLPLGLIVIIGNW